MLSKLHKHLLNEKASRRLVIFCTFLLIFALIAALVSFFIPKTAATTHQIVASYPVDALGYKTESLSIATTTISIEIADTEALREQGLSNRTSLQANQGMLFVFPVDSQPGFWMKDMHFPLDIIWLDDLGTVVDITNDFLPSSYPSSVFPKSPIRYALEVNAGFVQTNDIHVGEVAKTF